MPPLTLRRHAFPVLVLSALLAHMPAYAEDSVAPKVLLPVVPPNLDYVDLFTPLRTELAALSPDGRQVAYTFRNDGALALVVVDADRPAILKKSVVLLTDREASTTLDPSASTQTPARALWLGWSDANSVVVETNRVHQTQLANAASANETSRSSWMGCPGLIVAYNPDSGRTRTLVTPDKVAATRTRVATIPQQRGRTLDASQSARVSNHLHDVGWAPAPSAEDDGASMNYDLIMPGIPSVIGFAHGTKNGLVIRGDTVDGVDTYQLDARSGKLRPIGTFRPTTSSALLIDAGGRPRIQISTTAKPPVRLDFTVSDASTRPKWAPVAARVPAGLVAGFALSPENFFGHRAVPLAFDASGNTLLFASNVGRETFGIYGVDLESRTLTDLAIEHPTYDLYLPQPGLFPDPALSVQTGIRVDDSEIVDAEIWDPKGDGLRSISEETATGDSQWTAAYRRFIARAAVASTRRPLGDPSPLVFDRFTGELIGIRIHGFRLTTSWFRPELIHVQTTLEREFPDRNIEIKEWDKDYETFLVLSHGPSHPGTYNLYHRVRNKFVEFASRSGPVAAEATPRTVPFVCDGAGGTRLSGTLTFPRAVRDPSASRVPLVVLCSTEPWTPFRPEYSPEVQALARMGLAVARINTRGMWGSGVRNREGFEVGFDRMQATDLITALDHLGANYPVNLRRVAILGEGLGGHLALRAVQQYPDRFRSAVAIEAPINLQGWLADNRWSRTAEAHLLRPFFGSEAVLAGDPLRQAPAVLRPVCLFAFPGNDAIPVSVAHRQGRAFASSLADTGVPAEFFSLPSGYLRREPGARAEVFRHIEAFLNTTVYDFKVGIGEREVLPDP